MILENKWKFDINCICLNKKWYKVLKTIEKKVPLKTENNKKKMGKKL